MTAKDLDTFCVSLQQIGSGATGLLDLSKRIDDTDKYTAIQITNITRIIVNANEMLHQIANEIKPE